MAEPGIWGRRELGRQYLDYVLIVIDSGPAGQQVALRAARDRRVALIEQ
jgi:pyruvate/2-oxoglutarate dehydrogenase complex dihydrolipoamide dehydrogenase (E3) component